MFTSTHFLSSRFDKKNLPVLLVFAHLPLILISYRSLIRHDSNGGVTKYISRTAEQDCEGKKKRGTADSIFSKNRGPAAPVTAALCTFSVLFNNIAVDI